jgi:4-alpha-glucanotransferase
LLKSGANYATLMITDILDSRMRINTPGTVGDHNWTYRVDWGFDEVPTAVSKEMRKLEIYSENHNRVLKKQTDDLFKTSTQKVIN